MISYSQKLRMPFDVAFRKVKQSLHRQGFITIGRIDLQDIFRRTLNTAFRNYQLLSVCHPHFTYQAVSLESRTGMLPCMIAIQEHENGEVEISAVNLLESIDQQPGSALAMPIDGVSNRLRSMIDDLHFRKHKEQGQASPRVLVEHSPTNRY